MTVEEEKHAAATYAAGLVEDGMRVGLGTGSTVAPLIPALAARGLRIRCVVTSEATAQAAIAAGLIVESFDALPELDIAIDGADQIAPGPWLIKGGGRAHTREKLVAAAAARFVVIASHEKPVPRLTPPVPLELLAFGLTSTLRRLRDAVRAKAHRARTAGSSPTGPASSTIHRRSPSAWTPTRAWSATACSSRAYVTDVVVATGPHVEHTRHAFR